MPRQYRRQCALKVKSRTVKCLTCECLTCECLTGALGRIPFPNPRRGSVVSAVPYKFTFGLYAIGCLANLSCAYRSGGEASGEGWQCALPHGSGLTTTLLLNSTILAVFRF